MRVAVRARSSIGYGKKSAVIASAFVAARRRNHPIRRQGEVIAQLHPSKGKGAE